MPENLMQTITIQPRGVEETRSQFSGLFTLIKNAAAEIVDAATGAGDAVEDMGERAGDAADATEDVASAASEAGEAAVEMGEGAAEAADAGEDMAESARKSSSAIAKMKASSNSAIAFLGRMAGKLRSAATAGRIMVAGGIAAGITAIATAIGVATSKAIGFENALNEARKTAGLSERQFRDLQEGLLDVQAELGTSQQELADIAAEAGRLGIESPDRIQEFTRTVALMSEATVASASETAQGLAKISNAFDLPIERAEALGSVINELSNQTVANASQIIDAMTRVGAAGRQVGLAADQVAGFAATLVDAGIDARRAGTGLRTIFTRMVNNSEKLAEQTSLTRQEILRAFEEDGLPAIRQYLKALRELPKAQRAAAIEDIFGVEQSLKVQTLVQNIDALNRQISDAQTEFGEADSLAAEFAATTKDVANEWNRLTAKLSAWVTDFGDQFTGVLESALSSLNDMLGTVDELNRDLSDAQGRLSSVEDTQRLVDKLKEARQAGEDTSELIQKIAKEVPQRFLEVDPATGDVIGVQTDALQKYLDTLRSAAKENLTERQTEALQQLNQAFQRLRRAQSRVDVFEPGTEGFKEARNQVQSANEEINTLLRTIKNRLPEGAEEARRALRKMLGDVNFRQLIGASSLGAQEGQEFLFGRLAQLEPPEPEDKGGATTPGGSEGPSPEQRTKARKKLLEITRRITQEEQLRGAANEEARQALQNIFDLKARIRRIDELQNTLQGEQLKKAKEQKQVLQDRLEEQKNALEEAGRAEEVQVLDPEALVASAEETAKAFKQKLTGEIRSIQEAAGAQSVGVLGVDVEEMVSRIEEQRKRLEQGEINPAQFAEEARSIAKEYRSEIEKIIDRSVQLTTLTEEQGKRMKQGLKPARDEAQALRADFIQTIGDLQRHGEISAGVGAQIAEGIRNMSDEALKKTGSLSEALKHLKKSSEDIDSDAIDALLDALEESTEQAEDLGEALQDTARFVRGIGDLASQFGDLSDEAEAAIDSTATVLDNVGRLVELSNQAGGFSNIFSSFSGAVSGIGAILGAAGGLASLLFASGGDGQPQKKMEELRKKIDENVRALKENTEAVLEQARVGENISRRTLERANELISQIVSSEFDEMSSPQQDRLLTQLENLAPMFEGVPDLLENVETYFMGGQPISDSGQIVVSDQYMRQLAREFVLTDATAQDIVDRLDEKTAGISTSGGLTKEELLNQFGNFSGIGGRLAEIEEQFAQFSDTMSGVIEELNFRRQELGASFEQLRSVLSDRLPDLGFGGALDEILQKRIEDASRGELEDLRQKLAESLAGDRDLSFLYHRLSGVSIDELLGDVTPSQFEDFLDQLGTITDVSQDESETDFSTSAAKARIITEHQANEVVSFLQELVQLARTQRDLLSTILASLGGEPPESPPASESSSAPEAPPTSGAPSVPGVGIPADLQETIAAAEANGFRPPVPTGQRSMKKIVNEGQAVYNINLEINGEMSAERTARKVKKYLDEYLPRG